MLIHQEQGMMHYMSQKTKNLNHVATPWDLVQNGLGAWFDLFLSSLEADLPNHTLKGQFQHIIM